MKKLILLFSLITLFILSGQNLYACSCVTPGSDYVKNLSETQFSQFIEPYEAIFIGRIVKKKEVRLGWKITFEVEKYWKGVNSKRFIVYTDVFCSLPYKVGVEYLVPAWYSSKVKGRLSVFACAQQAFMESKDILVRRLGTPLLPPSKTSK